MKLNKELIKRLANGEIQLKHTGTVEQLNEILQAAFPYSEKSKGKAKYYKKGDIMREHWIATDILSKLPVWTTQQFYEHLPNLSNTNNVNHPKHYGGQENVYEAIKVIEAWELNFSLGNAVKYIARAGKKDASKTVEDLEKAKWYLEREIERLKK